MTVDREKLDELYGTALEMSIYLLEKSGEFYPIGSVVKPDGAIVDVVIHDGDEHPESQTVMASMRSIFRQQAATGEILACALAYDIRLRESPNAAPSDAICVELRAHEFNRDAIIPYRLNSTGLFKKKRNVVLGEAKARPAEQDIFF